MVEIDQHMEDVHSKKNETKKPNAKPTTEEKGKDVGMEELTCRYCVFDAEQSHELKKNLREKHDYIEETFQCLICDFKANNQRKII